MGRRLLTGADRAIHGRPGASAVTWINAQSAGIGDFTCVADPLKQDQEAAEAC